MSRRWEGGALEEEEEEAPLRPLTLPTVLTENGRNVVVARLSSSPPSLAAAAPAPAPGLSVEFRSDRRRDSPVMWLRVDPGAPPFAQQRLGIGTAASSAASAPAAPSHAKQTASSSGGSGGGIGGGTGASVDPAVVSGTPPSSSSLLPPPPPPLARPAAGAAAASSPRSATMATVPGASAASFSDAAGAGGRPSLAMSETSEALRLGTPSSGSSNGNGREEIATDSDDSREGEGESHRHHRHHRCPGGREAESSSSLSAQHARRRRHRHDSGADVAAEEEDERGAAAPVTLVPGPAAELSALSAALGPLVVVQGPAPAAAAPSPEDDGWRPPETPEVAVAGRRLLALAQARLEAAQVEALRARQHAGRLAEEKTEARVAEMRAAHRRARQEFQQTLDELREENAQLAARLEAAESAAGRRASSSGLRSGALSTVAGGAGASAVLEAEWRLRLQEAEAYWRERMRGAERQLAEAADAHAGERRRLLAQLTDTTRAAEELQSRARAAEAEARALREENDQLRACGVPSRHGRRQPPGAEGGEAAETAAALRARLAAAAAREEALVTELTSVTAEVEQRERRWEAALREERQRSRDAVGLYASQIAALHQQLEEAVSLRRDINRELQAATPPRHTGDGRGRH